MTNLDEVPALAVPPGDVRDGDAQGEHVEQNQEGVRDDGEDSLDVDGVRHVGVWIMVASGYFRVLQGLW